MTNVVSVQPSGNADIDALLAGKKWASGNLTYSFPTSAAVYPTADPFLATFEVVPDQAQNAIREALAMWSQYANLTFTEITETKTVHADFRWGMSSGGEPNAAEAGAVSFTPGDPLPNIFLNPTDETLWGPSQFAFPDKPGSFAWHGLLHEIGHALGFQHATDRLPPEHDGWDYSQMDYRVFPGQNPIEYSNTFFHAQTPMIADIAAIQYLYGANFSTNSGNTVYSWNNDTGEEFINGVSQRRPGPSAIYETIWDGGGVDTYDFSNFTTNLAVDLRPGEFTAVGPTAVSGVLGPPLLGSQDEHFVYARGNIANALLFNGDTRSLIENANGGSGDDTFVGNQGNNTLRGNGGDDTFLYNGGVDQFLGGARRSAGDLADFSHSDMGVIISPVATTIVTPTIGGGFITVTIDDTSPRADAEGNAYDVLALTGVGVFHIADLRGIEHINGSPFADTIVGNRGDNVIDAGAGNDRVRYTGGFDDLAGGDGTDTIDFSQFGFAVSVTLSLFVGQAEAYTTDTSSILVGTAFRPIAELSGFENIVGSPFVDSLIGNKGNNNLDGGAGGDFLFYDGGLDVLNGNTGIDTADFSRMTSAVHVDLAGGGFEAQTNGTNNASARGTFVATADLQSIENVTGTRFSDVLRGDANANVLAAGAGHDVLQGRAGSDTYDLTGSASVQQGNDQLFDDSGASDRVIINSLNDIVASTRDGNDLVVTLANGAFRVIDHFNGHPIETLATLDGRSVTLATGLIGGSGSGIIAGGNGGETLDGGGGDDFLFGGNGRDRLIGGIGDDHLTGGHGHDTFVFGPGFGHDTVTDFSHADTIAFEDGTFDNFKDVLSAARQVGNDVLITLDADNSVLLAGVDIRSLHASDFHF